MAMDEALWWAHRYCVLLFVRGACIDDATSWRLRRQRGNGPTTSVSSISSSPNHTGSSAPFAHGIDVALHDAAQALRAPFGRTRLGAGPER